MPLPIGAAAAGALLKRISPKVWIGIGIAVAIAFTIWRGIAWYNNKIDAAEQRGEARAVERARKEIKKIEQRTQLIVKVLREKNDEEIRNIARSYDDIRVRGPGRAGTTCIPTSSGGRQSTGGQPNGTGPDVSSEVWASVPWNWLVNRSEVDDLNRNEVLAWRDWHAKFTAEWAEWIKSSK